MSHERKGADYFVANRRKMNEEEKKKINPCMMIAEDLCKSSGVGCNWIGKHMIHPDAQILFSNPPIFNLTNLRNERLATKEKYRVL